MIHEWMSAFREPRSSEMKSYFRTGPKAHLPLADGLGRKHPQGRQRRSSLPENSQYFVRTFNSLVNLYLQNVVAL